MPRAPGARSLLLVLLSACSGRGGSPGTEAPVAPTEAPQPSATPAAGFRFVAIPPVAQPDGTVVLAGIARTAAPDEAVTPLRWQPLLHQGQATGDGQPFGTVVDRLGRPLDVYGQPTNRSPDGNALLEAHGHTWLLTHHESSPAAISLTRLRADAGGTLTPLWSRLIDPGDAAPFNQLCAAERTPWNTMLGGEEYETDAALLLDGRVPAQVPGKADGRDYFDESRYPELVRWAADGPPPSPYRNGFMQETQVVDADGRTRSVKHFAMGRFSHELGRVMPDRRTVYMSDDYSYGMLAMFVADRADDLSAGHLYAARWRQDQGATATLEWIDLGHATNQQVAQALDAGTPLQAMIERQPLTGDGCPTGFTPNRAPQAVDECLRAVPGGELAASRLETRRYAALAGATTELHKEEGLAVDARGRRLFVAFTRVQGGMLADDPPWPERDHVRLPQNDCGVVYAFDLAEGVRDSAGQPIDSAWVASAGAPAAAGVPGPDGCATTAFKEPDNLAFVPQAGALLIAEDTDRAPNMLWALQDGALLPLFAAPDDRDPLAEVSGLGWAPDVAGAGWITLSLQHNGQDDAVVGVLGPLPVDSRP